MSNPSITADKTPWYQWDTGLTVTVSGGEMDECHFANRKQGTAYVQAVINGVARVPDELLQVAAPIKAYGYVSDGAGGQTYVEQTFDVIARNIPADYTYTKTAQKTIRDAEQARDEAVQAANNAKASELAADDSAVEASTSAQSAGDSASAAATSASNAAKSAGDAANSASDAKAAAGEAVEDASALLKTYTDNAKTSADNAATSASNAADAASAASGSASAAEQSATDASNAKVAAQTAKAEAEAANSEAATSASNAAASATAAAKSASDAAASVGSINVIAPKSVGTGASASGTSIAFGNGATSNAEKGWNIAIGYVANSKSAGSIVIGSNAHEELVSNSANVVIGDNARITGGEYSIAIGAYSESSGVSECSVGAPKTDSRNEITREITHVSEPSKPTSAATKKYTDDNDAKTLSDAKKYTDANTSNALVGTVSGNLLHVDDAWPSKTLSVTIDGAYKQDGTPSPESPVPITVVENPVLRVTGRNLLDFSSLTAGYTIETTNGEIFKTQSGKWCATLQPIPIPESLENLTLSGNDTRYQTSLCFYDDDDMFVGNRSIVVTPYTFKPPANAKRMRLTAYDYDYTLKNTMVEVGKGATYASYSGASIPITLPAEHPYLAALPDGTHDTIEIDKYGNASLVARVQRASLNAWRMLAGNYYAHFLPSNWVTASGITNISIAESQSSDNTGKIWFGTAHSIVAYTPRDGDTLESINAMGILGYFSQVPVTYNLGKLDIPSLPETISNVWTDAELTTNMSMTYKRDINIAFENLAQAVVAAAAGE